MNRDKVVRLSKLFHFAQLTASDISTLLIHYCVTEHNKPFSDTTMFVAMLLSRPLELRLCVEWALEYYERRFVVFKLWSAHEQYGSRTLLQIF